MGDNSTKSELKKTRSPIDNSLIRMSYYTSIDFEIDGNETRIVAKVDTGAAYTVFGLDNYYLREYTDSIIKNNSYTIAYDASGTELKLYGYIVNNFQLTSDIIFEKIKIFFSEDIGEKALLGMDILSLFDFQYLKEARQNWGTFWINNYTKTLDMLSNRKLRREVNYIDPAYIASLDKILNTK